VNSGQSFNGGFDKGARMECRLLGYSVWFIWAVAWFSIEPHLDRKRPRCSSFSVTRMLRSAKRIERCSDVVEDQGAEEALWVCQQRRSRQFLEAFSRASGSPFCASISVSRPQTGTGTLVKSRHGSSWLCFAPGGQKRWRQMKCWRRNRDKRNRTPAGGPWCGW